VWELVWRYDPEGHEAKPATAAAARERLDAGNRRFAELGGPGARQLVDVGPEAFGLPRQAGARVPHEPFAAVLGCSDARVPPELVFGQAANDLFVVRVAGNVPGVECVGSIDYAIAHLHTVRLVVVLGHTSCGAVTAAADAYLRPETYVELASNPPLRAIVDTLLAAVRMAATALERVHGAAATAAAGYEEALISVAAVANAALTASVLRGSVARDVVFGVFQLDGRTVGLPGSDGWTPGLTDAPADDAALAQLLAETAQSAL
jgi:carbonic anhydrase